MKIANQTVTATRLIQDALEKAAHFADYNIFTFLNTDNALKKAADIDARIKNGEPVGRLAGVTYAIKDNFLTPDGPTTAASQVLANFTSPVTATVVQKLDAEDAIMIGRTNLDAFAHGSSTESSFFGPTLNSADKTRVAGGSSGGSAVAVALDIVDFATGTDTGGSIRQPASFNGVFGFKPTYGALSRYGIVAMASSTDCPGFFAHSTADLDLLMSIAAGQDPNDQTTLPDFYNTSPQAPQKPTLGIIKDFDNFTLSSELSSALSIKITEAKQKGWQIVELDMPILKYALAVYYIITPAEIASNLSRFDGIRYGLRSDDAKDLDSLYANSRGTGFMSENKRRIMIGNFVLASGFYDAYYLKAQKARTLIVEAYEDAFKKCDFLLTPVTPHPAFKLGSKINDPMEMYLGDAMSVPVNLAGLPALAFPAGETSTGLSLGLQLVGPRRSDQQLLKVGKELA